MRRPIAALLILGSLSAAATIYAASSLSYAPLATPSDSATSVWYDPSQPAGQRDRNISLSTLKSIIATAGIDSSGLVPNTRTVNGYALTGPVVIGPADLTQTSTHRFTTDAEKATWNAKQNALSNAATIGKITESGGAPLWDGAAWPGGSGLSSVTSSTPTTFSSGTVLASSGTVLRAATKTDLGLGNVPNVDATSPANITQSASFRFASDTEKATWDAKQNAMTAGTDYATPAAVALKLNAANPTHTGTMTGPGYASNAADGLHSVLCTNTGVMTTTGWGSAQTGTFCWNAALAKYQTWNGSSLVDMITASGGGTWGSITGTLSAQTDLATALGLKEDTSNKSTSTSLGTSNTLYPTQGAVKSYVDTAIAGVGASTIPTVSSDPASPTDGSAWYNSTDHSLNISQSTGWTKFAGTYTAWDTTPTDFSFIDQTDVALSSTMTSAAITVAGINHAAAISVTGGTYDINASGSFTSSAGTVSVGDTVRARHTSSGSNSTMTNTVVTIGGVSDTFSTTTVAVSSSSDSFTGTDNTALAVHNAEWVDGGGYTVANFKISAGNCLPTGDWVNAGAYYNSSTSDTAQAVFKGGSSATGNGRYLGVRMGTSTRGYSANLYHVDGANYDRISILKGGTELTIGNGAWAWNTDHTIAITASGSNPVTLTVWVDGTQAATVSDSDSPIGSGHPGLVAIGNGAAANTHFDNFKDSRD